MNEIANKRGARIAWADEERIRRCKGLKEYSFMSLLLTISRTISIFAIYSEEEYRKKWIILGPLLISVLILIALFSHLLIKYPSKYPLLRHMELPFALIMYLMVLFVISVLAKIKNDYVRGLSLMYPVMTILYFTQFIFRTMFLTFLAIILFIIEFVYVFPHESNILLLECLLRLVVVFGLVTIFIYRFLKEGKENFLLRYRLKQSNELLYKFINSMSDNVIICSKNGIQYQNPYSKLGILAFDQSNYLQKCERIVNAANPDSTLLDIVWKYLEHQKLNHGGSMMDNEIDLCKDQEYIYNPDINIVILLNITLIKCGNIDGIPSVAIILKDITEKRRAEEQAIEEKYKNKILNSFSHEVRTPLNSIIGMISITKERISDKESKMNLELAESSGFFLKNQLADIEDCGHIVAGKFTLHDKEYINFPQLFEELEKATIPQLMCKPEVRFKLSVDEFLPNNFRGDKDRILQIMSNFLSNAIKYTVSGKISLKCTYHEEINKVRMGISDTGCGIPQSIYNKIFKSGSPTFQMRDDSKLMGMGLYISQMIAKKMSTKIKARSKEGIGSIFYFELNFIPHLLPSPNSSTQIRMGSGNLHMQTTEGEFIQCSEEARAAFPYISRELSANLRNMSTTKLILVVDDISNNRFVIKGLLKQFNIYTSMKEAVNGLQAVEMVKTSIADGFRDILIFMDLDMPVMNGQKAIAIIRRLKESDRIKIIVVSAFTSEDERTECDNLGIQQFFPKPVSKDILVKAVYKYLLP